MSRFFGNLILRYWRWERRSYRISFGGEVLELTWRDAAAVIVICALGYCVVYALFAIPE